jgi:UDP-glucose:(heptosyl)LPS alpha-1,3-glucosyltransferase
VKIALIVEWLDGWRGGAETSTQQFIHELVDLDVSIEVFTRSHVPSRPGVAVRALRARGPTRALQTLRFCRLADRAALGSGCDLIHAISPSLAAQVYQPRGGTFAETIQRNRALRRTRAARALKHLAQHVNLKQRLMLRLEREMLTQPRPPIVLALSDYVVQQLHTHYALPDNRIRKVFNGVAMDRTSDARRAKHRHDVRELYGVADQEVLALTVAHNFRLKGVRTLIDALARLRAAERLSRLRVLVVGKARTAPWEGLVQRRRLADVVQFVGPTQRISHFYHAADFLVHPTFYDPCSRVVLEALASGLPCITTRYDGAAEMVGDGESGFVLDAPEDVDTLADRIAVLTDDATRQRMRAAVRDLPVADMHRHAQEVVEIYRTVMRGAAE